MAHIFVQRHCTKILFHIPILIAFLFASLTAYSQEAPDFDEIAARAELDEISLQLDSETFEDGILGQARTRVVAIAAAAERCEAAATSERARLEARFEPLREVEGDVAPAVMDQRIEIRGLLDDAIGRQAECGGVQDYGDRLVARITERLTAIAPRRHRGRRNQGTASATDGISGLRSQFGHIAAR